ncbi:MAG TPA: GntR family transcriptional regulator [Acidobacteriaceae bacterium]|nr:GntR family transcriptional regulator [Acidobacteriaceae bacterium]
MRIVLSKESEVPLRQQLADQIVFLIATGQLRAGDALPSVRTLGRQSKVHHNTVSEAYQDLVRRGWLTRRPGSRLVVGKIAAARPAPPQDLDELINESIQRARNMGFSLQALRLRVRERLLAEPPDHFLVVEQEAGLREIIRREISEILSWPVQGCSVEEFAAQPGLAIGAQVVAAKHVLESLQPLVPQSRPAIGILYAAASEQIDRLSKLERPSILSLVSVSESFLKTARSLLAPAVGSRHVLNEFLVTENGKPRLGEADVVVCDTVTFERVRSRVKLRYRLIASGCLEDLGSCLGEPM